MAGANRRSIEWPAFTRQLVTAIRWTALALLVLLAAVFLVRRLSGSLAAPLDGITLVVVAIGLICASAAVRWPAIAEDVGPLQLARWTIPGIATIVLLAAFTLKGTPATAVAVSWFVLAIAEIGSLAWRKRPLGARRSPRHSAVPIEREDEGEMVSPDLIQQLARHRNESGGETVHAIVRVPCEEGDRRAVAHLAFCPPLATVPELAAYTIDESGAEATVTLAATYGARIEVRLNQPAVTDEQVLIEVVGKEAGLNG